MHCDTSAPPKKFKDYAKVGVIPKGMRFWSRKDKTSATGKRKHEEIERKPEENNETEVKKDYAKMPDERGQVFLTEQQPGAECYDVLFTADGYEHVHVSSLAGARKRKSEGVGGKKRGEQ